ncbi:histone deacetylase HDT1-like isoform X1 [Cicer arietinum]|uniref:Histone deacetylase HDT1-like n=1 Tax=Cicer arietinum TaxID=3827 RepID=A0A1S2YKE9_CICAR|nr:histone deacetylase HDT1-like [Cicer arietinum]
MEAPMEFWGIEVKPGQSVNVDPNDELEGYIHISQVALGEIKKDKSIEPVVLYLKVADQKLVLGTLIKDSIPHLALDIVLDKESELSHNSKTASIYFSGYKVLHGDDGDDSDFSDSDCDHDHEIPVIDQAQVAKEVAKLGKTAAKPAAANGASAKQVKIVDPEKDEVESDDDDSDEDFSEDDDTDASDEVDTIADSDSDEGSESDEETPAKKMDTDTDSDEDSESDEETPAKEVTVINKNKRPNGSASKTPVPTKKAKNATPEKTDGKKGAHTATPHPMKKGGKSPKGSAGKGQTPNSNKSGNFKGGKQQKRTK